MINQNYTIQPQGTQSIDDYYYQLSTQYSLSSSSSSSLSQESMAMDEFALSQIQCKNSLIEKLEMFYILLTDFFLLRKKMIISVVDLDKTALFNYDEGCYILPEDTKEYKYHNLTLYSHSSKIAQMLKVASIIYEKTLIQSSSTKRELYYNDVDLFKSTIGIDSAISDLCSVLLINHFQLPVFPSAKGLFAGNITIINKDNNIPMNTISSFTKINLITYDYISTEYFIESTARFILIVEKETLFFNIINNKEYQSILGNSIVITGKGYPDYLTKYFVKKISHLLPQMPIVYFGDYDPYGLEIYLNYLFGCKASCRENEFMSVNGIRWIGLKWEMIDQLRKDINEDSLIKINQRDIVKVKNLLEKEYFNIENWAMTMNPWKEIIVQCLMIVHQELNNILMYEYKAEGEFVISRYMTMFIHYIRQILLI